MRNVYYSDLSEVVDAISDREYQNASWFGSNLNLMDSPGEQIHRLLSGDKLDNIIREQRFNLDARIYDLLSQLKAAILAYQAEVGLDPDPRVTLDHPKWEAIRVIAREITSLLPDEPPTPWIP
ncbi:hypothetical protein [Microvirga brassicacearum]|uniref:Uncharacterized protein n=1 Tax=Microvirga brassicacearum TaxID=2580413 RepID=A0A5N3P4M8_9HYPH|nr:hypothetical protein [Microvirga brassicacearum]KAB0264665.1 hypothetical protein FEZ63_21680 [Microvirga brassicacearum]